VAALPEFPEPPAKNLQILPPRAQPFGRARSCRLRSFRSASAAGPAALRGPYPV